MLPGQLVNVLNVPFALSSGGRSRNDSVSSTSSEHRTMDPTDKFLNPRPVPAKPSLPRLKTSPTFTQQPWSSSSTPTSASSVSSRRGRSVSTRAPSQPGSANVLAVVRPKPSETPSRSTSRSSNRSVGIIGAFRALTSPLLMSPGAISERSRTPTDELRSPAPRSHGTSERTPTPKFNLGSGLVSPIPDMQGSAAGTSTRELALRRDFNDALDVTTAVPMSSFAQHRRQRSLSREPSSLRSSVQPDASPELLSAGPSAVPYRPLETVKEVASASNTPVWPLTALKVDGAKSEDVGSDDRNAVDLEKRLPTLPNTPSSAYPPSINEEVTQQDDLPNNQSHFSSTTVDTDSYTDSYIFDDSSRFSEWTDATTKLSPQSDYTPSMADFEPISPPADLILDSSSEKLFDTVNENELRKGPGPEQNVVSKQDGLPSASSFSTTSSIASSAMEDSHNDPDSAKSGHFSWSRFQHYSLPAEETGSGITLKPDPTAEHVAALVGDEHNRDAYQPQVVSHPDPTIPHSTSMQQLLDELSYLGGMIQQH